MPVAGFAYGWEEGEGDAVPLDPLPGDSRPLDPFHLVRSVGKGAQRRHHAARAA